MAQCWSGALRILRTQLHATAGGWEKYSGQQMKTPEWQGKIQAMINACAHSFAKKADFSPSMRARRTITLQMRAD